MTVGEELEARIKERYKNVRVFSNHIGVAYSTVSSLIKRENGFASATSGTLFAVCGALDLDVDAAREGVLKPSENPLTHSKTFIAIAQHLKDEGRIERIADLSKQQMDVITAVSKIIDSVI